MHQTVTLILSHDYAENISSIIQQSDVWIVESENNISTAESIWESKSYQSSNGELTLFSTVAGESSEDTCKRIISEINIHHPDWKELRIIGYISCDNNEEFFREFGVLSISENEGVIRILAD